MSSTPTPVSREEVLAVARELGAEYGESLTLTAFRRETGYSQHVIFDLFGNWQNLRLAIGLSPKAPRSRIGWSDAAIRDRLRALVRKHGPRVRLWDFVRETGISPAEIARRFGSWTELRQSIGLKGFVGRAPQYSDEDMMNDLLQVYLKLGDCPSEAKHRLYGGKISSSTMVNRFGSWTCVRMHFELFRRKYHKKLDPKWKPGEPVGVHDVRKTAKK